MTFDKEAIIYIGEKKLFSRDGASQTGQLYVETGK